MNARHGFYVVFRRLSLLLVLAASMAGVTWLVWAQDAPSEFKAYPLRQTQAEEVVARLQEMLSQMGIRHEVVADRQGNRILVRGTEEVQRTAAQLLQTLDRPAAPRGSADAVLPGAVRGYRVPSEQLEAALAKLRGRFPPASGARIAADPRTQQLLVVAPEEVHRQVAEFVASLADVPAAAPADPAPRAAVDTVPLKNISWRELEDGLRRVWGPRLALVSQGGGDSVTVATVSGSRQQSVMQIDRRRDSVRLLGTPATVQLWRRVIAALDRPRKAIEDDAELMPLHRADPQQVRRAVELLRSAAGDSQAAFTLPAGEGGRAARLASMIFQPNAEGPPAAPAPAAAPAKPAAPETKPAAPEAKPGAGEAKPGAAEGKPAEGEESEGPGAGLIGPVQVEFLEGLEAIVIRGHKRDVERVRKIIEDIERLSKETEPVIEIVYLRHVGCQAMETLVLQLYDEILAARQGRVAMRALVKPNAFLLIGAKESVEAIKKLIAKLDQPVAPESQFEVFRLRHASAVDAEQTVRNFLVDRLSGVGGVGAVGAVGAFGAAQTTGQARPALGTRVNVVSDFRSNSLIVQASPSDLLEVRLLIARIDVESSGSTNELRIFRLKQAMVSDVAPVLQDALNWQLIGNRAPLGASGTTGFGGLGAFGAGIGQQQERARLRMAALSFMTVDSKNNKQLVESGILADVRVTADVNGNALLITAPPKAMGLIEALVKELDRLPSAQALIKVFTIVNGDASTLANMLRQLLGQTTQQTGAAAMTTLFGQGAINPFLAPALQSAASIGESSLVPIRFGVDQRTNSIIVSGSEGDLGVVEAILLRLDEQSFREHKTTVYWLANRPAAQVSTAVNNWLTQRTNLLTQHVQLSPESPDVRYYRQVIVVPEAVSNSIIISATPELFEEVKHVVMALDRRRPLIKIDVLIAEVALTDLYELGAEFGLQDSLLFDRTGSPGYNFNNKALGNTGGNPNNVVGQALSSLDVGRLSSGAGYGGLVLSASRDSISALIRALEVRGRAQILSRPQIATLDNLSANINVGEVMARPGNTTQNATTTTTAVTDTKVGLLLGVTPSVTPDGLVVMEIDAERSRIDYTRTVTVNENEIPNIASVTSQTTISARSGQTVVFAGLIETTRELETRGIPVLSDIPYLGKLFEFNSEKETRRELLIVMTPYVVHSDDDLQMIRQSESERMSWCVADVADVYGNVGFSARPGCWCKSHPCKCWNQRHPAPVIYPDLNPTGLPVAPPASPSGTPGPATPPGAKIENPAPPPPAPANPPTTSYGPQLPGGPQQAANGAGSMLPQGHRRTSGRGTPRPALVRRLRRPRPTGRRNRSSRASCLRDR
jgi:type II secretory pathway component GspD/PulD (secretin)